MNNEDDFFPQDWVNQGEPNLQPITEAKAEDVINSLPRDSWLRRYCIYGKKQTTAPVVYHLGVGAMALGSTCPPSYGMDYGAWVMRPNIYTMLVGRSGKDRKSSALEVGDKLLRQADPELLGNEPGSKEGLLKSLSEKPRQTLFYSEFGKLLSSTTQGYLAPIKELFTDLWDNKSQTRQTLKETLVIKEPRLSIGAGVSIPYLERYTLAEDWHGGFMGRWMVLYGREERTETFPTRPPKTGDALAKALTTRATSDTAGWCKGFDKKARALWDQWYHDLDRRILPSNIAGVEARVPSIALRMSLILGWDFGPALAGKPWEIDENILGCAIQIAELHLDSVTGLSDILAEHEDARLRRTIMRAIDEEGGSATLGGILRRLKMRKRIVNEMIQAMIEMGELQEATTVKGHTFMLVR